MKLLVDGSDSALSPLDRGLQYGDGVFRTLRLARGEPLWWDDHLARLTADAARLGIPCPPAAVWRSDLESLGELPDTGVLKLILTRGVGARGYRPAAAVQPSRVLILDPASIASDAWPTTGLNARVCALRLGEQPALAGIKHLNRLENVLARAEWDDPAIHEGILLDHAGHVIGGVMSNLFFWRDGRLHTPRLDRQGVAGVTRARLLALWPTVEGDYPLQEVLAAEEVLLCNSVMGLRRLARLEQRHWPDPVVSPQLLEKLHGPA